MKPFNFIFIIFLLFSIVMPLLCVMQNALKRLNTVLRQNGRNLLNDVNLQLNQSKYTWNTEWYEDMPVDHFSYGTSKTYNHKLFKYNLI